MAVTIASILSVFWHVSFILLQVTKKQHRRDEERRREGAIITEELLGAIAYPDQGIYSEN